MTQNCYDWARRQVIGEPYCKLVLLALAYHADDSGRGRVSLQQLSDETEITPATKLPPYFHALENFGMLFASVSDDGQVSFRLRLDRPGVPRE